MNEKLKEISTRKYIYQRCTSHLTERATEDLQNEREFDILF
jgi:hypothetical protein